jgi:hypothetical protein
MPRKRAREGNWLDAAKGRQLLPALKQRKRFVQRQRAAFQRVDDLLQFGKSRFKGLVAFLGLLFLFGHFIAPLVLGITSILVKQQKTLPQQ